MENDKIIALLTDFGTKDYFVGAMKGAILSVNANAKIVDITHEIEAQDIRAASFTLRACCRDFPYGTIFVAVVDPGVGSERRAILIEMENYFFVAPDNGVLSFVFNETESFRVFELTNEKFFARAVSATFHGRDVFAPVAAHLSQGITPNEFGAETNNFVRFEENQPRNISDTEIEAEIIHIDRFGNLITNLKKENLPDSFTLEIGEKKIERLQNFYAENEKLKAFMIFGSANFLEVAVFQGSARKILNAEIGQKVTVEKFTKP